MPGPFDKRRGRTDSGTGLEDDEDGIDGRGTEWTFDVRIADATVGIGGSLLVKGGGKLIGGGRFTGDPRPGGGLERSGIGGGWLPGTERASGIGTLLAIG